MAVSFAGVLLSDQISYKLGIRTRSASLVSPTVSSSCLRLPLLCSQPAECSVSYYTPRRYRAAGHVRYAGEMSPHTQREAKAEGDDMDFRHEMKEKGRSTEHTVLSFIKCLLSSFIHSVHGANLKRDMATSMESGTRVIGRFAELEHKGHDRCTLSRVRLLFLSIQSSSQGPGVATAA